MHKSSVSTGFAGQIMSILPILCCNGCLIIWTVVSLTTAKFKSLMSLSYIAAEWTWTYSKHISRDRYAANLLARRSDLQKKGHVVSIHCCVTSPRRRKTQFPLLLCVGPCLQSCCLATRWSNPLQYPSIFELHRGFSDQVNYYSRIKGIKTRK
jgi:hypothetical protein